MSASVAARAARRPLAPADVAVIVPHYDDAARLARCLAALTADPEAAQAEIVVVDNLSPTPPDAVLARHPGVRLLRQPRRGAANARNLGAAQTAAPALFFLDADCVPEPGWLAAGRAALARSDIVGGSVALFDETPPPRNGAQAFETVFGFDQKTYIERKGFSVSANLLTWRAVFDSVGGFADGVSEDFDWCLRARAQGWRLVYAPEVAVRHPTRADYPALMRKMRRVEAEMCALGAGRRFARLRRAARAGAMALSPLAHAHRILLSPRLRGWRERAAALGVLFRSRLVRAGWTLRQALGSPV